MTRDEVDAGVRRATGLLVEVARAGQAGGKLGDRAAVPLPEPPDVVAILAVPLGPEHREGPYLITTRPYVPGLGNQLYLRENWILVNDVKEGAQAIDLVELSSQRAGKIEAEAVDMHLHYPVSQAVHDELQYLWMPHVEGVAAAREIHVIPRV